MNRTIYYEVDPYFWRLFTLWLQDLWLHVDVVSTLSDFEEAIYNVFLSKEPCHSLKFIFWSLWNEDYETLLDEVFFNYMQFHRYVSKDISFVFFQTLDATYLDALDYIMNQRFGIDVSNVCMSYGESLWFHDFSSKVDLIIEWNVHSISVQTIDPQKELEIIRV